MMKNVEHRINGYEIRAGNVAWHFDVAWSDHNTECRLAWFSDYVVAQKFADGLMLDREKWTDTHPNTTATNPPPGLLLADAIGNVFTVTLMDKDNWLHLHPHILPQSSAFTWRRSYCEPLIFVDTFKTIDSKMIQLQKQLVGNLTPIWNIWKDVLVFDWKNMQDNIWYSIIN